MTPVVQSSIPGAGKLGTADWRPATAYSSLPIAWRALLFLCSAKLALAAIATAAVGYGYSADELYFLDCANHLAWGYVDHPPLSIGVLAVLRAIVGDSLVVLRMAAAIAGVAAVLLTALMTRELGGGRVAQIIAALAMLAAPTVLFTTGYYSLNALDLLLWALTLYLILRVLNGADPRWWLAIGVMVGLALLNKWSALWLAGGIALGILLTPTRSALRTPWPWLAGIIAFALWTPNLAWQVRHDWPTLEFMRAGMRDVMIAKSPFAFVREQFRAMHPVLALLGLAGLVTYFQPGARAYRLLGWIWIAVFSLLMLSGSARPYYLAPAYPIVFAAGALAVERAAQRRRWRYLPATLGTLIIVAAASTAPLVMPILPPEQYIAYERALGLPRIRTEFEEGLLPPQFGFQFGWEDLTATVARAVASLPPDERGRIGIVAETFGEAAALNFFGRVTGLPRAIGTHNNYWLWGPGAATGDVMVVISSSPERWRARYDDVAPIGHIDCRYCMPVVRKTLYLCRRPRAPLSVMWKDLRDYS